MKAENIIIAGIGGQGTVLASRLIALAAMECGHFVRTAETIGMAQRGGSVTSHVRVNSENKASMIPFGGADLLIAFDPNEALRRSCYLRGDGNALICLPDGAEKPSIAQKSLYVDAVSLALSCGSAKTLNVVLLGAACGAGLLPFENAFMRGIFRQMIPEKYLDMNIAAFDAGITAAGRL